ncbi:MAG: murein biosynthesis integral membrane protein MurJ, partial [Aeromonas sp.]
TGMFCLKLLAASVLMGGLLAYLSPALAQWASWSMMQASLQLAMLLVVGGGVYVVVLLALGVRPRHLKAGE